MLAYIWKFGVSLRVLRTVPQVPRLVFPLT